MISEVLENEILTEDTLDYIEQVKYQLAEMEYPHAFTDCLANGPKMDDIPFLPKKNGFYEAEDSLIDALRMDDLPNDQQESQAIMHNSNKGPILRRKDLI